MDFVVMGESRGINDFADSTSKLGSIVQINSIAIDISSSMEAVESPVHEHFSIRGFVAGMRKKDLKTCFPFTSPGISDRDLVDYLPPLHVPEVRCWQCSSCTPNDEMKRTTEETVALTLNDATTSSCENVGGKDGLFINSRKNTGDKLRLKSNADGEDKDPTKNYKTPNSCSFERHKDIPCSKGKPDTRDIEAGNTRDTPQISPQQVIERLNNTPDASVLPQKRKTKLRSLADIMVGERNQTSSNPRTRSSSSCVMQVESTEMESVLVPQLEVDVSADVAKADQSSEQKRNIALGEEREPLAAISPRATVKRIKGLELDAEKDSTRVELISDLESKGDASMRLDLPRAQKIKPKKAKAIDTNKNMRPIRRDDEKTLTKEFLQPNNVPSANLQEQVVPVETNPGKNCRSSLSGQQMEKIHDLSMAKLPEVGNNDDSLMPLRKIITENCNIRGTVALDLSLDSFMDAEGNQIDQASVREHRCIPDLNVEYSVTNAVTEEQQSNILSEKRSLPLQKTSEMASASCSYGTVREGKQISCPKNKDTIMELKPSDDIPMEIVELLAKNQHERALGKSRRHLQGINDATKGYSAIEGVTSVPLHSRTNGSKVANGILDRSRPDKNHHFRLLSSSSPSQPRKPECATSASTMAGPSSIITWEELLYSSARENAHFPQLNHYKSFLDERLKERTVIEGKKAVANTAKLKEGRIGSNDTSLGSLDPYSNDTIPAMQLLSLMDQRVKSDSSPQVGTKSWSDNRPRLNGKENHNFLSGPFFPQKSSSKDLPSLRHGVYSSDESSFRASSSLRVEVPQVPRNSKSNEGLGECVINRNPADFSIPEVGNEFTITAKDLRFRKRNGALQEKLRRTNVDGRKRQRMRKNGSEIESSKIMS